MRAETTISLNAGTDRFTFCGLLRRAAEYKGLTFPADTSRACSDPIATYTLDDALLRILAEQGIKRQPRPDCRGEIFTLVDENPQEEHPGWAPSNYWNFKEVEGQEHRFDLRMTLHAGLNISTEDRGVVLGPVAYGTFLSPADHLPHFRMFQALTNQDGNALPVARELAGSDGNILVTWTELGLGGIRSIQDLFEEFAGGNESIERIARRQEVFAPVPYPAHQNLADKLFIAEPAQPKVLRAWRAQLEEYRASLVA